ncbi:permease [Asticcacaulis sp. DXS10W]|uniref:Permease n=1 Tax=Asticcacaulis currens TaxID=2984210 RepID=A0ABT5ICE0_9CAUL|nr:permease [Asticcacaulis currens]MDC7693657.1 permease [Asticcacaulis currens]
MIALLLLGLCIVAETALELCYKRAADATDGVVAALLHPLTWLGLGLWAVQAIAWILVLRGLPLAVAYPVNCLTYVTVPLASLVVLKEKLTARQVGACVLIASGVALVAGRGA